MKKTLAILLAVVMLLSSFCILPTVSAEENDNAAAAITISSEEDFLKIGNDNAFPLNGDYKLGNNITVRSVNYAPIGSYTDPFTGTFDGNGKTITVAITYTNASATASVDGCAYAGLFGCVKNATVTNLTIAGTMTVNTVCGYVGGIIGGAFGNTTVSYCTSDVDMTITLNEANSNQVSFIGGVVGIFNQTRDTSVTTSDKPTITYCVNKGNINVSSNLTAGKSASSEYNLATNGGYGGIVGASGYRAEGTCGVQITISYCMNRGDIYVNQGPQRISGILGCTPVYGSATDGICGKADISWCANYGDITRDIWVADAIAAIVGYMYKGTVTNCFHAGLLDGGNQQYKDGNLQAAVGKSYFIGYFSNTNVSKSYSYVANNFSMTPITGLVESPSRTNLSKYENNYVLKDTAVDTYKGNQLSVGSADGKEAVVRALAQVAQTLATDANLDAEAKKFWGSLKFAGLGDLATVYFDFNAPTGAKVLGYQVTDVDEENQTYNIRFISILDKLDYASAGYDVVATYGTNGKQTYSKQCEKVYTSLTGSVDGTTATYTRVGDYYIMAYAITGIPVSVGTVSFEVTPYVFVDGVKSSGETVTVIKAIPMEVDSYMLIHQKEMFSFASATASNVVDSIFEKTNVMLAKEDDATQPTAERYEIIVGNTEREETKDALAKLDFNQYGVFVFGKKIVIVGWTDYTTRLAAQLFDELLSDHVITKNDKLCFNFADALEFVKTYDGYLGNVPAFDGTIDGVYDGANGAYCIYYSDVTEAAFSTYESILKNDGYTLYTENTLGSNKYATYTKGNRLAHFYYIDSAKELRVIHSPNDTISEFVQSNAVTGTVTPAMTVMPMKYTAAAGGGACIIFTLTDGSFFVIDGGWYNEADLLYDTLQALNEDANGPDAPIVISAWFLSHAHIDHATCIRQFALDYGDRVSVNAILCNPISDPQSQNATSVPTHFNDDVLDTVRGRLKTATGGTPVLMKLHSGQKMTFGGMTVDVLFTHEDLFEKASKNYNEFSTVLRVTLGGNTFFLPADSTQGSLRRLIDELDEEVLKADFCQVAHHGADAGYKGIYEIVGSKYYIWNNSEAHYNRDTEVNQYDWCLYVVEHAEEIYLADTYCYTLELPYTAKSAIRWTPGLEKPSDKTKD